MTIEGHADHVRHLFKGFISPTWPGKKRLSVSGQHTATKKYLWENAPIPLGESGVKCCICNKVFKNKGRKRSAREHMKKHVKESGVADVDFDTAKQVVK